MAILTGSPPRPKHNTGRAAAAVVLRRRLLAWYARHRRVLPWRGVSDPYAVLVSETMLQQTQVVRVEGFYRRFLARYPTLEDLAAAPLDAVREAWDGLGYYARARHLHAAARQVLRRPDRTLPREPAELRRLPGVGRYTAAAVASLAFGADAAVVDTNVARVLTRVFGVRRTGGPAARVDRLWRLAERLVPAGRSSDWNQALMDLGATICTARAPRCPRCPVRNVCRSAVRRARPGRGTRR